MKFQKPFYSYGGGSLTIPTNTNIYHLLVYNLPFGDILSNMFINYQTDNYHFSIPM